MKYVCVSVVKFIYHKIIRCMTCWHLSGQMTNDGYRHFQLRSGSVEISKAYLTYTIIERLDDRLIRKIKVAKVL